ncbi:MAG: RsmB/NOP family class I SAM-dependent RNA methyltransferase [Ignisphaera sp.]
MLKLSLKDIEALIEAYIAWEKIKPGQVGKRVVFEKYCIRGTEKDRFFTALIYSVERKRGLVDKIVARVCTEIPRLNLYELALYRLIVFEKFFGKKSRDLIEALADFGPIIVSKFNPSSNPKEIRKNIEKLLSIDYKPENYEEYLEFKYSAPIDLVKKIIELLGVAEAEYFFKSIEELKYLSFRVNTLKASVEEVVEELSREGYRVEIGKIVPTVIRLKGPFDYKHSGLFIEGKIIPQDEAGALATILLDPRPGETVVDMCAAPGGKTTHIAELMKNKGRIIAIEIYRSRARRLKQMIRRAGISIAEIHVMDCRDALKVFGEGFADKVLLDPPCSNTGSLPKTPEAKWRFSLAKVEELSRLQKEMLNVGVKLLKPRGRLMYTTCSVLKEENEDNIAWALGMHKNCLRLVELKSSVSPGFMPGTLRTWPHRHNTMGFFYALIERIC